VKIAVAGATGQVGVPLVDVARAAGHEVVPIARSTGIDLTRPPADLAARLDGVEAVVDVTLTPEREVAAASRFFTAVARNLGGAARAAGVRRTVLLSIIGVDRVAASAPEPGGRDAHYRAKHVHEQETLAHAPGPRIVRAAQFHDLARVLMEAARQGDVSYVADMPVQPVDVPEVVRVLLAVATGSLDAAVVEVAGPRVERFSDLAAAFAARDHGGLRVEPVPTGDVLAGGVLLPGPDAIIAGPSFGEWFGEGGPATA
jgi:dTDP-4-dehydrorhamnose reductase